MLNQVRTFENIKTEYEIKISSLTSDFSILQTKYDLLQEQLISKDKELSSLREDMKAITLKAIERPTTTNMNNKISLKQKIINNLPNLPINELNDLMKRQLTKDIILADPIGSGISSLAVEFLKDKVVTTDASRNIIKFRENDLIIKDPGCIKLSTIVMSSCKPPACKILDDEINKTMILYNNEVEFLNNPDTNCDKCESIFKYINLMRDTQLGLKDIVSKHFMDSIVKACTPPIET
jgi:hypothetical protein